MEWFLFNWFTVEHGESLVLHAVALAVVLYAVGCFPALIKLKSKV
jgi:hypothetical protein